MTLQPSDKTSIRDTFFQLHAQWNANDGQAFGALFTTDGSMVGFDGSQVNGRADIVAHLSGIFRDHKVASFVGKVREVRMLADGVALVRAVAGMIPPGKSDVNPATNAIQSAVLVRSAGAWRVALFQNTPAAFHGRPADVEALTNELREVARSRT